MKTKIVNPKFFYDSRNSFCGSMYKYMSNYQYIKDFIVNKNIYMSDPQSFNDPFDCGFTFTEEAMINMHSKPSIIYSLLKKWLPDNVNRKLNDFIMTSNDNLLLVDDIIQIIDEFVQDDPRIDYCAIKNLLWIQFEMNKFLNGYKEKIHFDNNIKVCCFSRTRNSFPMWAHYANNHKGVCLEYDTRLFSDNSKKLEDAVVNVSYNESYLTDDITNYFRYFNKSSQWKYEEEVRIVCQMTGNYLDFPYLKSIYLQGKSMKIHLPNMIVSR